jgi:hypothetical protein
MEREVDEAMPLFFRERDEICEQDQPVGQPPAPAKRAVLPQASHAQVQYGWSSSAPDFISKPAWPMKINLRR